MADSKRSKHPYRGVPSVDRISTLPESLICHILSLLPTHCAVQTCILSKRWKNMWTSVTSLYFDDELSEDPELRLYRFGEESKRFKKFIYRVLVLLKTQYLQKFRLNCVNVSDPFHVNTWVSAALSRDVEELALSLYLFGSLEMPISLFTCKTLSSLSLKLDITLNVPNSVCLPKLKYMYLSSISYVDDKSIPKLLSGCPALEDLSFERTYLDNVFRFNISSPSLKSLSIDSVVENEPDNPQHTLQIDAPLLQYLHLNDRVSKEFVIGNVSSLTKAYISVHAKESTIDETGYGDEVLKLLNKLSYVKFLKLSGLTMKALSYAHVHVAPDLHNVARLEGFFSRYQHDGWCKQYEGWCPQPHHVHIYLLSHLTAVHFAHFDGSSNELEMVKHILNGAKTLERMTITTSRLEVKLDLLQDINMFPRVSKLCEVVVK